MIAKTLRSCKLFTAGDKSTLREILNPRKERLRIRYSLAWASVRPRHKTIPHRLRYSEVYYILKGTGIMHVNRRRRKVKSNDTIYIPPNAVQWIGNTGRTSLHFLCIVDPAWEMKCERVMVGG